MSVIPGAVVSNSWAEPVSRSLRFNSADSAYLHRTPASNGNRKTWTWSGWIKRSNINVYAPFMSGGTGTPRGHINFNADNTLTLRQVDSTETQALNITTTTTLLFRDVAAWYHIVGVFDTTQAVSTNRAKLYVNGVQITSFATAIYPSQNQENFAINSNLQQALGVYLASPGDGYFPGYMTEINFIDGQALDPTYFGMTDPNTSAWIPKRYNGAYGTNGYYVTFADNSSVNATTLGKDYSPNGNNWTPVGFSVSAGSGDDSLIDVPTQWGTDTGLGGQVRGNYATLNTVAQPLLNQATTVISNGNLNFSVTQLNSNFGIALSTIGVSSGKWYFEYLVTANGNTSGVGFINSNSLSLVNAGGWGIGQPTDGWARSSNGTLQNSASGIISGLSTFTNGDVIGCAVDFDAGKMWFSVNGTWDLSGNPSAGTNQLTSFTPGGKTFLFGVQGWTNSAVISGFVNFGQRPFSYTAPSGFKTVCTTNLPTPTIGATSSTLATKYYNTVLYTGNGGNLSVTGVGFQPDFNWLKCRNNAGTNHLLEDVLRGTKQSLMSNNDQPVFARGISSFDADGFSFNDNAGSDGNPSGGLMVAYNWKAGGAGVTNTQGTITSTVSANTTSGFSVVTYTGSATNNSIGHGLNAIPKMVFTRTVNASYPWLCYHSSLGRNQYFVLNTATTAGTITDYWGSTDWTTNVFRVYAGGAGSNNVPNQLMVAYCWAEVSGYSAFGTYTGNGSGNSDSNTFDGPFVYTGFRPAYVFIKVTAGSTDTAQGAQLFNSKQIGYNTANYLLRANSTSVEGTTYLYIDILSNGFKIRNQNFGETNGNGNTYIWAAFAESPFKYANAR